MADDIEAAWAALRGWLESRSLELHDELRGYPTPIARCDEQLTRLIEQRDAAFQRLRLAAELDAGRASVTSEEWAARVRRFAATLEADDDGVLAARARLVAPMAR